MRYLNKLPGFRRSPSGMEWRLLRKMPLVFLVGSLLPGLVALLCHMLLPKFSTVNVASTVHWVDIMMISVVTLHWTWTGTLTIGCIIVMLMKGPAYVADEYPLPDADRPADQ